MDRIINSENLLAYELTSKELSFVMNSNILSFELKSYHAGMPIYAIVLDFIYETGGIY